MVRGTHPTHNQNENLMSKTANILIVDDTEANREILSHLVTQLEHTVILAENGLMALEKLKIQSIDLVLLDIMMPNIDGYEVLSHIKDDTTLQHIPVIMVTSLDDTDSAVSCIKIGAEDYITRPVNRILLKARIGSCLEKKYLRDKEEEYRHQIEAYNLRLEDLVREQTQKLVAANERLEILNKAKGDALKFLYYRFGSIFKGIVKERVEETNELLDNVKQSFQLTQIESKTVLYFFELNAVRHILQIAIELTEEFANSRHVSIGALPNCGEQALEQDTPPDLGLMPNFEDELSSEEVSQSLALSWQLVKDDEQSAEQKELCANALVELIKTAIKFSRYDSTVNLSCEPSQNEVTIGIHANGRTLPEAEAANFFEVPSNEKPTLGRHPGPGPSIVKNIIMLLGGTVTVENRESEGISLIVKLRREILHPKIAQS
jgi:two-component system, sensor histidine kinase and response regulator